MALEFDSVTHTYRLDGVRLPSVTQALSSAGIVDINSIPDHLREFALARGTAVHRACELDDLGDLDDTSLDPALVPYLTAWRAFRAHSSLQLDYIEHRFFVHHYLKFAGMVDRAGEIGSHKVVLEIKTNSIPRWAPIQLAAYAVGAFGWHGAKRFAVALHSDSTFRVCEYPRENLMNDWRLFQAALSIHNWKENHQ